MQRIDCCFLWPHSLELNGADCYSFTGCKACFRQLWGQTLAPACRGGRDRQLDVRSNSLFEVYVVSGHSRVQCFELSLFSPSWGVLVWRKRFSYSLETYLCKWGHLVFMRWSSHIVRRQQQTLYMSFIAPFTPDFASIGKNMSLLFSSKLYMLVCGGGVHSQQNVPPHTHTPTTQSLITVHPSLIP